jgi:hypothetical protein
MKRIAFAAAALAAAALGGSASAATNLVTNGSFESGFVDWDYSGVTPEGAPVAIIFYDSASPYPIGAYGEAVPPDDSASASPDIVGTRAAYFVADNASETLSQTVFLDVGVYTIGFSAYVPFNGFGNEFNAFFTGAVAGENLANFSVDGSTPGQWVHYAGVANITTAGDYTTTFQFNSGPRPAGDVVIDRVYIVAGDQTGVVPEPGTWALMILGFGGAGAALRRSRRMAFAG